MRTLLVRGCWIPAALWVATLIYIRPYDGWGAWAAAPLLVPALALSGLWAFTGTLLVGASSFETGKVDWTLVVSTLVGGSMLLYYVLRYFVTNMA
jgi:hypothetical protein